MVESAVQVAGAFGASSLGGGCPAAWAQPGGSGLGRAVVVMESAAGIDHEDLAAHKITILVGDYEQTTQGNVNHGTKTLGTICASDNGVGVIRVAPCPSFVGFANSDFGLSYPDTELQIIDNLVTAQLLPGAVIQHALHAGVGPVELTAGMPPVFQLATALGGIVVESAGNFPNDFDDSGVASYYPQLDPTSPKFVDSGAIMVGGATHTVPHANMFNKGVRVDCHAWAEEVLTTVGSTTQFGFYSGTSAASSIIAGVAVAVQGMAAMKFGAPLSPATLRNIFRNSKLGTPSANPATDKIGSMPDLRKIVRYFDSLKTSGSTLK
ncbi:MAG: S8 family serine peptidase [Myxococcales bacterium]|nr:S8 family serine peptidase [Myxococcales bacterium]